METSPSRLGRAMRPGPLIGIVVGLALLVIVVGELASTGFRPLGFSVSASLADGLQNGAIYSLIALGIALVYRSTNVINFAQGELGTVPALLVMLVMTGFDLNKNIDLTSYSRSTFVLAIVGAVLVGALLGILVNVAVVQRLANASPVTSLVATAGVTVLLTGAELAFLEAKQRPFPRLIDGAPQGFKLGPFCFSQIDQGSCLGSKGDFALGGQTVQWNALLILLLLLVVSLALAAFFRSSIGIAMLASSQDAFAAELYGVSAKTMSTLAWAMAGGFGALAGILASGVSSSIQPGLMTSKFLVFGLVAAVLGGVTSMGGAVLGGLIIGVLLSISNSAVLELGLTSDIPGTPFLATFAVLVLVLVVRPRGLFGKAA